MKEIDELYGKMLAVFEEKTGFTMDDTADLAVRLYAAAAQIQTLYAYSDWAINQSFPQTATGEYLDYHAALRGIVTSPLMLSTVVLAQCMPVATNTTILCYQFGRDEQVGSSGVFLSTMIALASIPAMMSLLF